MNTVDSAFPSVGEVVKLPPRGGELVLTVTDEKAIILPSEEHDNLRVYVDEDLRLLGESTRSTLRNVFAEVVDIRVDVIAAESMKLTPEVSYKDHE